MIVLLSGEGKYSLEERDTERLLEIGKELYHLLSEGRDREFALRLGELHAFVKRKGKKVEIFRLTDIVIPPADVDPAMMERIFGFQKSP